MAGGATRVTTALYHNRTRTSASIPRALVRRRRPYLVPLYYLLMTSDLAREGVRHSGSARFADHIYADRPSGRLFIGAALDRLLLRLPSARAFRARYFAAKGEIHRLVRDRATAGAPLDVLAVPSGYARELFEAAAELEATDPAGHDRVSWHGIDLDGDLVARLQARPEAARHRMRFAIGDAFADAPYEGPHDLVVSLGLVDFLADDQTVAFLSVVRRHLKPEGRLVVSAFRPHPLSELLLRHLAELRTSYRSAAHLAALCRLAGFDAVRSYDDATGLQTTVVAGTEER